MDHLRAWINQHSNLVSWLGLAGIGVLFLVRIRRAIRSAGAPLRIPTFLTGPEPQGPFARVLWRLNEATRVRPTTGVVGRALRFGLAMAFGFGLFSIPILIEVAFSRSLLRVRLFAYTGLRLAQHRPHQSRRCWTHGCDPRHGSAAHAPTVDGRSGGNSRRDSFRRPIRDPGSDGPVKVERDRHRARSRRQHFRRFVPRILHLEATNDHRRRIQSRGGAIITRRAPVTLRAPTNTICLRCHRSE